MGFIIEHNRKVLDKALEAGCVFLPKEGTDLPYDIYILRFSRPKNRRTKPTLLILDEGHLLLPMTVTKMGAIVSPRAMRRTGHRLENEIEIRRWAFYNYHMIYDFCTWKITDMDILEAFCP